MLLPEAVQRCIIIKSESHKVTLKINNYHMLTQIIQRRDLHEY